MRALQRESRTGGELFDVLVGGHYEVDLSK